jgi:hypothetical protein
MRTLHYCSALFASLAALPAAAALIVDTGAGANGQPWSFETAQYFAGEFSVGSRQVIQSVEGYYSNIESPSGSVTIRLHRDGGNIRAASSSADHMRSPGQAPSIGTACSASTG